jgi:DNA recombination protein RmuC
MHIPLVWLYFAIGFFAAGLSVGLLMWYLLRRKTKLFEEEKRKDTAHIRSLQENITRLEDELYEASRREAVFQERLRRIEPYVRRFEDAQKNLTRLQEERAKLRSIIDAQYNKLEEQSKYFERMLQERDALIETLKSERHTVEAKLEEKRTHLIGLERRIGELNVQLEEEREHARLRLEEFNEAKEMMRKEFEALASNIMRQNSLHFGDISKARVEEVLKPLREEVGAFKKRIEEVHTHETKELATLMHEIRSLKELNLKIGEDAKNLTKALRGESKTQGIWGEMVLERVLEASGLREGEEYEREVSLQNDEQKRYRPDVIVHLPDKRDIIIDAKTSLLAYERYVNAEDEAQKHSYALQHLQSVNKHIEALEKKRYERLEGVNTLDFIFLFMPVEGALMLALQTDPSLYDKAFSRRIVLVSPTTLLVALRAVEHTWRTDKQSKNALEIAKKAGDLYDKFVGFTEELEKVGKQLDAAQKSYRNAWKRLSEGRGNLVRRVEELRTLGAKAHKELPDSLKKS